LIIIEWAMVFQPIEAFSVGRWQDAGGTIHDFPAEVVSQIAETYNTSRHRAAIVTNHSELGPAKGFIKALKFIGDKLFAEPEKIKKDFKEEVDAGEWPNVSIRLYPPHHNNNPTPGKWSLRHLSYVVTGAVKGLATPALVEQSPAFAENEDGFVDLFLAFEDSTEASSDASESLAEAKTDTDKTLADDAPEAPADVGAEDVSEAGIPVSVEPPIESPVESVADSTDESLEHSDEPIESIQELPPDDSPGDPPPNKETPMTIDEEKKVEAPGVVEPSDSDRQLLAEFAEAQAALVADRERLDAEKAEMAKLKADALTRTLKSDCNSPLLQLRLKGHPWQLKRLPQSKSAKTPHSAINFPRMAS
jgi:hypothetical protein